MTGSPEPPPHRAETADVKVRAAEPEDRSSANAVQWSVGWAEAPTRHRFWPEADADWQARHYYRELVAEVDGVVGARVGLEAYRQPFAELCNLCVRPDYRRRGLGQMLTRACQEEASRRGFALLFLQTEIDNLAAHRLYTGLGFVPTTLGKMLRMVKFLDYPLLADFCRTHPLYAYNGTRVADTERAWTLEWHGYVLEDWLRLRLEGGSCLSDSEGIGPALTGCDWRVGDGARGLRLSLQAEAVRDIEPGHHVALEMTVANTGRRMESGVFQMALPPGLRVSSPATNTAQVFTWKVGPGEQITQPVVVQIERSFDAGVLWHLNYSSVPVCIETYWEGHRALLSSSLHLAAPPPRE